MDHSTKGSWSPSTGCIELLLNQNVRMLHTRSAENLGSCDGRLNEDQVGEASHASLRMLIEMDFGHITVRDMAAQRTDRVLEVFQSAPVVDRTQRTESSSFVRILGHQYHKLHRISYHSVKNLEG